MRTARCGRASRDRRVSASAPAARRPAPPAIERPFPALLTRPTVRCALNGRSSPAPATGFTRQFTAPASSVSACVPAADAPIQIARGDRCPARPCGNTPTVTQSMSNGARGNDGVQRRLDRALPIASATSPMKHSVTCAERIAHPGDARRNVAPATDRLDGGADASHRRACVVGNAGGDEEPHRPPTSAASRRWRRRRSACGGPCRSR